MYNVKVQCVKSGNLKDVIVGDYYYVIDGFLHTRYCPWAREQEKPYLNIDELNNNEQECGNEFIEVEMVDTTFELIL